MNGRHFVDTNVLVYAVDTDEPEKGQQARRVLADDSVRFVLSAQVLGEYFVTVTRKLRVPMSVEAARADVADLSERPVVPIDQQLVQAAIDTARTHQLSYWDALIIEAAAAGGCTRVLSEDMNAGATIRGVEIVNPFA